PYPIISSPSAFTPSTRDGQAPSTTPSESKPGIISNPAWGAVSPNSGTNTSVSVIAQPSEVSPPAVLPPVAPKQPARRRRNLYIVLIALLVAVVAGSGLIYALLIPKGATTPSPSNAVVGHVTFLSSSNTTPPGSVDEVEITLQS